jgi:hypothetical protein
MLSRSIGARKLLNGNQNSNNLSIGNANSTNINNFYDNVSHKKEEGVDLITFSKKTLLPYEQIKNIHHFDKDHDADVIDNLKKGEYTMNMLYRTKIHPIITHAGKKWNKFGLSKTNTYRLSKRKIFEVRLVPSLSYRDSGSKSLHYVVVGIIDKDSEFMNKLTPKEEEFVNTLYHQKSTLYLNSILNNSNSSADEVIPVAGNLLSGIFTGGRHRRTRKRSKKTSRRRRSTRKH